jgi:hypothetical protein
MTGIIARAARAASARRADHQDTERIMMMLARMKMM